MDNITVSFEDFEHLYNVVRKAKLKELRFELVVGSLFPDIMNNIKEEMRKQHALGFAEGQKQNEKEGSDG